MVRGTFHFASNQDAVKHKQLDVLGAQRQAEITELNKTLTRFAPDRILVEWEAGIDQPYMDSTYAEYLAGHFTLRSDEVYQVVYRLAKELGTGPPQCIDAPGQYLFDTLRYAAELGGQLAYFESHMDSLMHAAIADDSIHQAMSIREALIEMNGTDAARLSQAVNGVYIAARTGPVGSYAAAEFLGQWYQRNIRMYANICRAMGPNGQRALVLVGNGHRIILEQILRDDPEWELVPALEYLR